MKLIHLSDLHLGKRVNEFDMLEDQRYILGKIAGIIDDERPDAVIVAGDIYDRSVPPAEAVQLFDDLLCRLAERELKVFIISGNHDSAERVAFASRLLSRSGVYLSPVYDGKVEPVTLEDVYGPVDFYLLPFLRPVHVRCFCPGEIVSYTDALRAAVGRLDLDPARRNVLVTHQFVTGASRSDSEDISVGGTDNVDASVFDGFDYVALGHIHRPQDVGGDPRLRYCGTPLKYSFSEAGHQKSVTVVTLGAKGSLSVRTVPLVPRRDLRELRGRYDDLTLLENYAGTAVEDYLHITLTDENDIPDAIGKLRAIYPNVMKLDYDNARTQAGPAPDGAEEVESKTPIQLFAELYEAQNGRPMSEEQAAYAAGLIETIWEEGI